MYWKGQAVRKYTNCPWFNERYINSIHSKNLTSDMRSYSLSTMKKRNIVLRQPKYVEDDVGFGRYKRSHDNRLCVGAGT